MYFYNIWTLFLDLLLCNGNSLVLVLMFSQPPLNSLVFLVSGKLGK